MAAERAADGSRLRYLLVVSEEDPVATRVADRWGTLPATGDHVEGAAVRALAPGVAVVRRPGWHVEDDGVDERLPPALRAGHPTLIFPSIHRSESGHPCFTVHPLGNPGPRADVGGRPMALTPTSPRFMADALRRLAEAGRSMQLPAVFEATHHGPRLASPAFFAEIGFGDAAAPPPDAVRSLASALATLTEDPRDRIALGIGGGHYAPHFTELALERHWAFGHLLSRHALNGLSTEVARDAWAQSPGAAGILAARAADYREGGWETVAPRLRDGDGPRR